MRAAFLKMAALAGCLLGAAAPAMAEVAASPDGAALYVTKCGACHGAEGQGVPGFAPQLAGRDAFWAALGDDAPTYLAGVMVAGLAGRITAAGQTFAGQTMPPQNPLSEAEITAIGDFVLAELAATALTLDPAIVAAARADRPAHSALLAMRPAEE